METCPQCNGFGEIVAFPRPIKITCELCRGSGKVSDKKILWVKQGKILRGRRMAMGITLREAARRHKVDVGNLSRMERGVVKPKNIYGPPTFLEKGG